MIPERDSRHSPRRVILRLYTRSDDQNLYVSVAVAGESAIALGAKVVLDIVEGDTGNIEGQWRGPHESVMQRTLHCLMPGAAEEAAFPLAELPKDHWSIRPAFVDRHGNRCDTEVVQDRIPTTPEWFGSAAAVDRKIPAPWTPLTTVVGRTGIDVSCWGRDYRFRAGSILEQLSSLGVPLLHGPVRLVGRIDGREITWRGARLDCVDSGDDQVVIRQRLSRKAFAVEVNTEIEFDGMVRVDFAIVPKARVRVDALCLEIPLCREGARYLYQYRGRCGDDKRIGLIPARGLTMGFRPFVWIGDEDRGLGWFAESDENWFNANPDRCVSVRREGDAVVLRLQLVSKAVELAPPNASVFPFSDQRPLCLPKLTYTFGLQATPVKPVVDDAWDYRIICLQQTTAGIDRRLTLPRKLLDRLVSAGVRTLVVFEHWSDIEAHATPGDPETLHRIVSDCHERGIQVLLYFGFLISERAPEWPTLGPRCVALPKTGWSLMNYPPQPVQTAWRVCLRSCWQDFLADRIGRMMDEFDVDGVYLDGTANPYACRNLLHGCGTLRYDGSIGPTFPIFGVRSAMRRIYSAVKSRKPNGQVNVHNSTCMTTPTLGWATSTWDGEQFSGLEPGTPFGKFLMLDAFRTEFMGRQWGVPAELLCYGKPMSFRAAWALAILHDVPVRPMFSTDGGDVDLAAAIWRVMDEFDRKGAQWFPYWQKECPVRSSLRGVPVSVYVHEYGGVLLAASNLTDAKVKARLRLKPAALGLTTASWTAVDAITGETVDAEADRLVIELPPLDFVLVRLGGAGGRGENLGTGLAAP